jgi:hypothetical protein
MNQTGWPLRWEAPIGLNAPVCKAIPPIDTVKADCDVLSHCSNIAGHIQPDPEYNNLCITARSGYQQNLS